MPTRVVSLALLCPLVGFLAATPRAAVEEPLPSLRQLCLDAPAVVLATPTDPLTPLRFRVQSTMRGPLKEGDTITPTNLQPDLVRTVDDTEYIEGKPRRNRVAAALLFLESTAGGKGWRVFPGGLRFCTEHGQTLAPIDQKGTLRIRENARWTVVVARVREDVAAIEQLEGYRRIGRPTRRAQSLMSWVQRRKAEFATAGAATDESPGGWGRLQLDVFDWIFAAANLEDAWAAVRLYAELNHGEAPRLLSPTFASRAGRAFLAKVAADPKRLLGERTRAVQMLADRRTILPTHGGEMVDNKERETLLSQLAGLLGEKEEGHRVALAQAIVAVSQLSGPPAGPRVVPALLRAYKDSLPGPARDELAMALCGLAGPGEWKDLTGNPPGVCVCLRDFSHRENTLTFWLALKTPGPRVLEAPTLIIERFSTVGFIADTKRFPLEVQNLDRGWKAGWNGEDSLVAQFDVSKLAGNNHYRARVEGYVGQGKDRKKWISEGRKFRILPRPNEQPGMIDMMVK